MKHDDEKILQEVQHNAGAGMMTINTILDKIGDDEFSLQLSRQSLRYAQLYNKATEEILREEGQVYRTGRVEEIMRKGSIHAGTAFNISRGHLAEMMIESSHRGITGIWKTLQHNRLAAGESVELAQELVDLEQESIERLRRYL